VHDEILGNLRCTLVLPLSASRSAYLDRVLAMKYRCQAELEEKRLSQNP
jgi:hypothetical protein